MNWKLLIFPGLGDVNQIVMSFLLCSLNPVHFILHQYISTILEYINSSYVIENFL